MSHTPTYTTHTAQTLTLYRGAEYDVTDYSGIELAGTYWADTHVAASFFSGVAGRVYVAEWTGTVIDIGHSDTGDLADWWHTLVSDGVISRDDTSILIQGSEAPTGTRYSEFYCPTSDTPLSIIDDIDPDPRGINWSDWGNIQAAGLDEGWVTVTDEGEIAGTYATEAEAAAAAEQSLDEDDIYLTEMSAHTYHVEVIVEGLW